MAKREVNYPHTIGFRLGDDAWLSIEREVANTVLTPHDWCRLVVLDRLHQEYGLSKNERILFEQFARTQYLVANGFQLLADDKLTSEEWKKFRAFAKEKIDVITDRALAEFLSKRDGEERDGSRRPSINPNYESRV